MVWRLSGTLLAKAALATASRVIAYDTAWVAKLGQLDDELFIRLSTGSRAPASLTAHGEPSSFATKIDCSPLWRSPHVE